MPLIVALLMVVISAAISESVLDRLSRTQESYLDGLAGTYLDGLSSAVLPAVLRGDVWEVFDALDRSSSSYEALRPIETVVTGADGRVLAATDPQPDRGLFASFPRSTRRRYGPEAVTIDEDRLTGFARRELVYQGQPIGAIHATFDVSHLFAERREVLVTLLVTNAVVAGLFAFGGFLLVRRMIGPMRVLENHMRSAAHGAAEPISAGRNSVRATARWQASSMATTRWCMPSANAPTSPCSLPKRRSCPASAGLPRAWRTRSTIRSAACSMPSTR